VSTHSPRESPLLITGKLCHCTFPLTDLRPLDFIFTSDGSSSDPTMAAPTEPVSPRPRQAAFGMRSQSSGLTQETRWARWTDSDIQTASPESTHFPSSSAVDPPRSSPTPRSPTLYKVRRSWRSTSLDDGSDLAPSSPSSTAAVAGNLGEDGRGVRGNYSCVFPGCTSAYFQTQDLLRVHSNLHSTAYPHYCPVAGCPRSQGGKGFRLKSEKMRHRLAHYSPEYACPFCQDREYVFLRPDNLQR
jgi:hypothetical protein